MANTVEASPEVSLMSTEELLWAPKRKRSKSTIFGEGRSFRKKLSFENPSSPVKEYVHGWYETRTTLAPCKCFIGVEACNQIPCVCPKKKTKVLDMEMEQNKKIDLKCHCPIECKELQSAQELF